MIDEPSTCLRIPIDAMHGIVNNPSKLLVLGSNGIESAKVIVLVFVGHFFRGAIARLHSEAWILCGIQEQASDGLAYHIGTLLVGVDKRSIRISVVVDFRLKHVCLEGFNQLCLLHSSGSYSG